MSLLKLYARDRIGLIFGVIFVAFYVVALLAPWIALIAFEATCE